MPLTLSTEQLALKEARRLKKLTTQNGLLANKMVLDQRAAILRRDWARLRAPRSGSSSVKVMTWNVCDRSIAFDGETQ